VAVAEPKPQKVEVSDEELDAILAKAASAPLSEQELELLKQVLDTLRYVTSELEKKRVSVQRLKALLFGPSTEKTRPRLRDILAKAANGNSSGGDDEAVAAPPPTSSPTKPTEGTDKESRAASQPSDDCRGRKGHGRNGSDAYDGAEHHSVSHPTLNPSLTRGA
jgi:hypothetical protein